MRQPSCASTAPLGHAASHPALDLTVQSLVRWSPVGSAMVRRARADGSATEPWAPGTGAAWAVAQPPPGSCRTPAVQ